MALACLHARRENVHLERAAGAVLLRHLRGADETTRLDRRHVDGLEHGHPPILSQVDGVGLAGVRLEREGIVRERDDGTPQDRRRPGRRGRGRLGQREARKQQGGEAQ